MKYILLLVLIPAFSWALTETEISEFKAERPDFVSAACEDNSFLRGCFHLSEIDCKNEVRKSFDGCWKFLKKRVSLTELTLADFTIKFDGCTLRDVGLQSKFQGELSPVCVLPKREAL